jgi:prepilin signal peptidase PulO-like enzyme (type II secretory pathway)
VHLLAAGCGLLGLLIGSFLNVVVHRSRAGVVVSPPSAVPRLRYADPAARQRAGL